MGVQINVKGLKASESSEALNRIKINGSEECDISIEQSELLNGASMLNDMEINCAANQIETKMKNRLTSFAGGVLQNLISDMISGKMGF